MGYQVRALTPELAVTFADYLSNIDFGHAPHWATCFCTYYQLNCSHQEWQNRSGDQNRREAMEQIKSGRMKGYLAFDGDKCIGWCNANDASRYIRLEKEMKPLIQDKKVGCGICYVIHPDYRRQGIARLLLKTAIEGFRAEGYTSMLALPVDAKEETVKLYRGTLNMYMELGFQELERHGDTCVMWLNL